jgi:transcriptional regulator GlxA family with amidase domain
MTAIKTVILHPDPCQVSSLAIAQEVLETANRLARYQGRSARFEVETLPPRGEPIEADLIVLPGLGLAAEKEFHRITSSRAFQDLVATLAASARPETTVAGACSGCFALGRAGLLNGRLATCPWWLEPFMQSQFPKADFRIRDMVMDQGNLVTAGAAFSQIDLMLHLVERFIGFDLAQDCRRFLMADQRQSQLPYVSLSTLVAADPALQKAELFAQRNLGRTLTVAEMARSAGLGARTFARRLNACAKVTPSQFLQSLRLTEAIRLAQTSTLATDEIAFRVGYSDASAFRRLIKRRTGRGLESFRQERSAGWQSSTA